MHSTCLTNAQHLHNIRSTGVYSIEIFLPTVAPTIEFEAGNVTASESDSSVTVNLVKTGNHSNNITVCINVIRVMNPAIVECMCILMFTCSV